MSLFSSLKIQASQAGFWFVFTPKFFKTKKKSAAFRQFRCLYLHRRKNYCTSAMWQPPTMCQTKSIVVCIFRQNFRAPWAVLPEANFFCKIIVKKIQKFPKIFPQKTFAGYKKGMFLLNVLNIIKSIFLHLLCIFYTCSLGFPMTWISARWQSKLWKAFFDLNWKRNIKLAYRKLFHSKALSAKIFKKRKLKWLQRGLLESRFFCSFSYFEAHRGTYERSMKLKLPFLLSEWSTICPKNP